MNRSSALCVLAIALVSLSSYALADTITVDVTGVEGVETLQEGIAAASDGDTVLDCDDRCPGQDDRVDVDNDGKPDCLEFLPIPTVSEWGLVILALIILGVAKICFRRVGRTCSP